MCGGIVSLLSSCSIKQRLSHTKLIPINCLSKKEKKIPGNKNAYPLFVQRKRIKEKEKEKEEPRSQMQIARTFHEGTDQLLIPMIGRSNRRRLNFPGKIIVFKVFLSSIIYTRTRPFV